MSEPQTVVLRLPELSPGQVVLFGDQYVVLSETTEKKIIEDDKKYS